MFWLAGAGVFTLTERESGWLCGAMSVCEAADDSSHRVMELLRFTVVRLRDVHDNRVRAIPCALVLTDAHTSVYRYGDFSPKSAGGRAFFIAWSLWGISIMTLTISVLTESYSSRFKSTIVDSNSRRLRRRSGEKARESRLQKLLASEGFQEDDEVEAKDLPAKLLQTVKGFHSHARYFMVRVCTSRRSCS